ncbi:hypothetical protein D3C81_1941520 [compost metagenome]
MMNPASSTIAPPATPAMPAFSVVRLSCSSALANASSLVNSEGTSRVNWRNRPTTEASDSGVGIGLTPGRS